tara:strand:+ start:20 stop:598 length:579 start_codon:yes stop_codon:yes gene_type:complete
MNKILSQKNKLRKILTKKRNNLKRNSQSEFDVKIFNNLKKFINFSKINFVASFISIRSEIATNQLNQKIIQMKKILSFPTIVKNKEELVFKKFNYDDELKLGQFNIFEPIETNEEIIPQLFFVPCLGFDLDGYRLGYGGGFYDKTFAKLKQAKHKFYAVGYAFDEQKQSKIPIEKFDYKLDFVLTEKQLYTF